MAFVTKPPMPQTLTLQIKGLYTNFNELSEAPDGAQKVADNIWISKDSVAESRRGFAFLPHALPNAGDRADKLGQFQNSLIIHYNNTATTNANDSLAYYSNSSGVNTFTGVYAHPDPLLARMKFAESNQNLYFTTAAGVYKLDLLTNQPTLSGVPQGLDVTPTLGVSGSGFMSTNTEVGYRIVWGITDANNNLVLGAPSAQGLVANASGSSQNVTLAITIPVGITTSHIVQIYRSSQSASSSTSPFDDGQLVYQANPTSGQISALTMSVTDIVPDALRGAALYTNATQQGILQLNNRPPYCLDLGLFQTCMFYANTQTAQQMFLTLLAVGGSTGIANGDTLLIAGQNYVGGASEIPASGAFKIFTGGSASQNITDTANSLIRVINQCPGNTQIYAYYLSTTTSLPGQMVLQARTLGTSPFSAASTMGHGSAFLPTLPISGTSVSSTNTQNRNGLMFSKAGIPEAVPFTNILYVGSASAPIRKIIPLRNSLLIFKDDGVFRCTGVAGNFVIDTLDTTVVILAPESAVSLNNNCYVLTTQGVCAINDNGSQVMSRPIEDQLVALEGLDLSSLQDYSFGVSYESERQYNIWTVSNQGETYGTQCFIYNTFTKTWTRSTRQQTHGLVLNSDNRLYLLNPNSNGISQERKAFTYADYTDEAYTLTLSSIGGGGATLTLNDASNIVAGDLLYQSLAVSAIVSSVNYATNVCTMATVVAGWSAGAITLFKAIPCLMEWLPIAAGNPGYVRHFREIALIFKNNSFTTANLNVYSEISSGIDRIAFTGAATGTWGTFAWGSGAPWGGVLRSRIYRTYVPREKQFCDLLSIQFQCQSAWATFQVEGLSTIFRTVGERMTN